MFTPNEASIDTSLGNTPRVLLSPPVCLIEICMILRGRIQMLLILYQLLSAGMQHLRQRRGGMLGDAVLTFESESERLEHFLAACTTERLGSRQERLH